MADCCPDGERTFQGFNRRRAKGISDEASPIGFECKYCLHMKRCISTYIVFHYGIFVVVGFDYLLKRLPLVIQIDNREGILPYYPFNLLLLDLIKLILLVFKSYSLLTFDLL